MLIIKESIEWLSNNTGKAGRFLKNSMYPSELSSSSRMYHTACVSSVASQEYILLRHDSGRPLLILKWENEHHLNQDDMDCVKLSLLEETREIDEEDVEDDLSLLSKRRRVLWATVSNRAFLAAAVTNEAVVKEVEHFYFGFKVSSPSYQQHSVGQTVDSIVYQENSDASGGTVTLSGTLEFQSYRVGYEMIVGSMEGTTTRVAMDVTLRGAKTSVSCVNKLVLHYATEPEEQIFGFGQQFPFSFDMKGKRIPILVAEQGVGRGLQPLTVLFNMFKEQAGGNEFATYAPMPHYTTSQHRSFLLTNRVVSVFDLSCRDSITVEVNVSAGSVTAGLHAQILRGNSPKALLTSLTEVTGRMPRLPNWVSDGAIIGTQGGATYVNTLQSRLAAHNTPIAAYWLQDWVGNRVAPWGIALWWTWNVDASKYPDWPQFVASFRAKNIRIMTYINSYVANLDNEKDYVGCREKAASVKVDYHRELLKIDGAVRNAAGEVYYSYVNAAMFDLTNPACVALVKTILKDRILAHGVSGYMCDYGEGLPLDASLFGDIPASEFHNAYPEAWARINYEAIQELGMEDEVVFFMRTGFLSSPRHTPLFWLGDQIQSWDAYDGLKNAVFAATTGGFSGFAITHADIGGYNCLASPLDGILDWPWLKTYVFPTYVRSRNLFFRGCEFGALSSVYRTHDGTHKHLAWQIDSSDDSIAFFSRMAQVYVAWRFYRLTLLAEATALGYPVIRHMYFEFPSDPRTLTCRYQYMLGSSLLVALVTDNHVSVVSVYVPAGAWRLVWDGIHEEEEINPEYIHVGPCEVVLPAPMGYPVILYRVGCPVGKQFIENLKTAELMPSAVNSLDRFE